MYLLRVLKIGRAFIHLNEHVLHLAHHILSTGHRLNQSPSALFYNFFFFVTMISDRYDFAENVFRM